jgi:hypothetical protein
MSSIIEHNVETGEIIEREMTKAEFTKYEKQVAEIQAQSQSIKTAKESAEAKLAALGLTAEDLRALGL